MYDVTRQETVVSVIGLGYIGLPTAAVIASRKFQVLGVDINPDIVNQVNQGKVHFKEPELDILVHAVVTEGYFQASVKTKPADIFIIAVPTPLNEDHVPNLDYIHEACNAIAPVLASGNLVILESTSPVGTTEDLGTWLSELRPDLAFPSSKGDPTDVNIAYCPERVLPGHILHELVQNDRVVGGLTATCSQRAVSFYQCFVDGHCIVTSARTAEMCKLAENSFRDVNIAFANELSMICDKQGIDVWELLRLANRHPRVNILQPGPGVGGHCIAVDPWFIVHKTPEEAQLIAAARHVNDAKPQWVIQKVQAMIAAFLQVNTDKTAKDVAIAVFGLTFKPNVDDLRESPSLAIAETIAQHHPSALMVVEPHISVLPTTFPGNACLVSSDDALTRADICIVLVRHRQFDNVPFEPQSNWTLDLRGSEKQYPPLSSTSALQKVPTERADIS